MKKHVLLIFCCAFTALAYAQTTDTIKKSTPVLDNLEAGVKKDTKIFTVVEVMPSYPGGADSLYSYFAQHIIYPRTAFNEQIGGNIIVTFVVEKDGSLSNLKVKTKTNESLNSEAIRVMSEIRLIPGTQGGHPVRVASQLTIRFDPDNPHMFY